MGWSKTNDNEISDEGLDASTHWVNNTKTKWQTAGKPIAADWLRLLSDSIGGDKEKSKIKQFSASSKLNAPEDVVAETKQFSSNLNNIFKNDLQRDVTAAESYLHALIALSTEDSFSADDKKAFDQALNALKQ